MIAITANDIRTTGGAYLDQGFLKSRSLTEDEVEIIRRSDWLRAGNPYRVGVYFAAARSIHWQSTAINVVFLEVSEESGKPALVTSDDEKFFAITSINQRFDASRAQYAAGGDLHKFDPQWGTNWPAADRFEFAGKSWGDIEVYHHPLSGLPTAKNVPKSLGADSTCWMWGAA